MSKSSDWREPVGDPFIVFEVCYRRRKEGDQVCVATSLAGRDASSVARWAVQGGRVSGRQLEDLVAHVGSLVVHGVTGFLGVQEELPLG